jgi:hypothetical protein
MAQLIAIEQISLAKIDQRQPNSDVEDGAQLSVPFSGLP